jgi:hypothetical protein
VLGYGAALAAVMGTFEYTGGTLFGTWRDPTVDRYAEMERLRTRYRTPGEETIAEIGEGRGTRTAVLLAIQLIYHSANHLPGHF